MHISISSKYLTPCQVLQRTYYHIQDKKIKKQHLKGQTSSTRKHKNGIHINNVLNVIITNYFPNNASNVRLALLNLLAQKPNYRFPCTNPCSAVLSTAVVKIQL